MSEVFALLPTGEAMAPDERIVRSASFRRSNVALWARLDLTITSRRLVGREPNLFLGLVEVGSKRLTYPLPNIAAVGVDTSVWIAGLLTAVLFVIVGLYIAVFGGLIGWAILLLALAFVVASFRARITITNNGGGSIVTRIAYVDRRAASEFAQVVTGVLAGLPPPGSQPFPQALSEFADGDPRDALRRLAQLRDEGLIGGDDYERKKQEILARL